MINKGQCFIYHFSDMADDFKGYFFTGLMDDGEYVMCEMLPQEEITPLSFMRITEREWKDGLTNEKIELI